MMEHWEITMVKREDTVAKLTKFLNECTIKWIFIEEKDNSTATEDRFDFLICRFTVITKEVKGEDEVDEMIAGLLKLETVFVVANRVTLPFLREDGEQQQHEESALGGDEYYSSFIKQHEGGDGGTITSLCMDKSAPTETVLKETLEKLSLL